ncbi:MAG: PaaI family thioesterase [Hyphomicrobiaceae bacterium]
MMTDEEIRKLLSRPEIAPPCARFLGLEVLDYSIDGGWAELAFTPRAEMANPAGVVQGGFVAAMLDDAMGLTATITTRFVSIVPTLQLSVTFLEPAPFERLLVCARVLRLSKSTAQLEASIRRLSGQVLATATASAVVRPLPDSLRAPPPA